MKNSNSDIISENFLMIKKCREKRAVPSSSSNDTINVHLTFYLKTMEDSFTGKRLLLPLLRKMQNPSDWLEFITFSIPAKEQYL